MDAHCLLYPFVFQKVTDFFMQQGKWWVMNGRKASFILLKASLCFPFQCVLDPVDAETA